MLEIKESGAIRGGHRFDYELEDGTLLHHTEWNGQAYYTDDGYKYTPIEVPDEDEVNFEVIGFERSFA